MFLTDHLASREIRVIRETKALPEHRDHLDRQGLQEHKEPKACLALELKVHKAMRELQVFKATTAHKVAAEFLVRRETPELRGIMVLAGRRERRVTQA